MTNPDFLSEFLRICDYSNILGGANYLEGIHLLAFIIYTYITKARQDEPTDKLAE